MSVGEADGLVVGCRIEWLGSGEDGPADILAPGHWLSSLDRMQNFRGRFHRGILQNEDFLVDTIQPIFA